VNNPSGSPTSDLVAHCGEPTSSWACAGDQQRRRESTKGTSPAMPIPNDEQCRKEDVVNRIKHDQNKPTGCEKTSREIRDRQTRFSLRSVRVPTDTTGCRSSIHPKPLGRAEARVLNCSHGSIDATVVYGVAVRPFSSFPVAASGSIVFQSMASPVRFH